jgi:hypothetical protein
MFKIYFRAHTQGAVAELLAELDNVRNACVCAIAIAQDLQDGLVTIYQEDSLLVAVNIACVHAKTVTVQDLVAVACSSTAQREEISRKLSHALETVVSSTGMVVAMSTIASADRALEFGTAIKSAQVAYNHLRHSHE